MRKTVDVFLRDQLVASYPVVVEAIDQPTDAIERQGAMYPNPLA